MVEQIEHWSHGYLGCDAV